MCVDIYDYIWLARQNIPPQHHRHQWNEYTMSNIVVLFNVIMCVKKRSYTNTISLFDGATREKYWQLVVSRKALGSEVSDSDRSDKEYSNGASKWFWCESGWWCCVTYFGGIECLSDFQMGHVMQSLSSYWCILLGMHNCIYLSIHCCVPNIIGIVRSVPWLFPLVCFGFDLIFMIVWRYILIDQLNHLERWVNWFHMSFCN